MSFYASTIFKVAHLCCWDNTNPSCSCCCIFFLTYMQGRDKPMEMLTYLKVDENMKRRVKGKTGIFGQEMNPGADSMADKPVYEVRSDLVESCMRDGSCH